jgi:hypothetical protein
MDSIQGLHNFRMGMEVDIDIYQASKVNSLILRLSTVTKKRNA